MNYYRICTSNTPGDLEQAVERLLNDGWFTVGGISVTRSEPTAVVLYAQALILSKGNLAAIEEHSISEELEIVK